MVETARRAVYDPASVAVVGASDDSSKWGYWVARGALRTRDRRAVHLVNRSADTVQGESAFATLADLPTAPELVALCVPPRFVYDTVAEAIGLGTRAFVVITAGVPEEAKLAALVAESGACMIGPNSLGLYDCVSGLQLAWGEFAPGNLAIVSQSGQLGTEIAGLAAEAEVGISRFVSIGDQIDVTAAELLDDLRDHDATKVVALYVEGFGDGSRLVRALRALSRTGKRVIVLTTGASDASRRLARSHTGSLTATLEVVDAACRAGGAVRVATPTELVNLAQMLVRTGCPNGRRVAVISDSGGQGGIAADIATGRGLRVPTLSPRLQELVGTRLGRPGVATHNPIDLAGAGEADMYVYADLCELVVGSGEVDAVVLSGYLGRYGEDAPSAAAEELAVVDRLAAVADSTSIPVLVHSMSRNSAAIRRMRAGNLPTFTGIEFAMGAIAGACRLREDPGRDVPPSAPDDSPVNVAGYRAARSILADLKIPTPGACAVRGPADLSDCARLTFPVVLKAGWLRHKSEHSGVHLGIASEADLRVAYAAMRARLGDGEYVVEEQDVRPGCVEMLVGARRDRDFGAVVVVGSGGTTTELTHDVSIELAPVDQRTASSMIERLRCLPLLRGWRGSPAVDVVGLAAAVVSVSEAIARRVDIAEMEINPVRVGPDGCIAVDALVVPTRETDEVAGDRSGPADSQEGSSRERH